LLFILFGYDDPEKSHLRYENYEAHKQHIASATDHGIRILVGGPLLKEDGDRMIGSFLLVEAESKATLEAFVGRDPFKRLGLWKEVHIERFEQRSGSVKVV